VLLPAGYELRAPTPDDFDAVAAVMVADELDDAGQVTLGADFIGGEWSRLGANIATDAWVAVDRDGTVVAYAQVLLEDTTVARSWGVVHPEHRGRGVGSALIDRVDARATELLRGAPSGRFRHAINANDRAAAVLLEARGLRPVHHFWHMQTDLAGPPDPGPEPEGIDIAGIDPAHDLPIVHSILDEAFIDDRSHHPKPFARWVEDETSSPHYDPTLWLLARDGGESAGVLTASVGEDRGWVEYLAVLAPFRSRGIASALLRRSFAAFADRGVQRALVSVDAQNPTGATGVYERVGMRVVKRWDLWERTLDGS